MVEILGFVSAVLVLVAALFGLIPPILSSSAGGRKTDHATADLINISKVFFVIVGCLGVFFLFTGGMRALSDYMSSSIRKEEIGPELRNISDEDFNLVKNAELFTTYADRDAALKRIIEFALEQGKQPLATLAASKLSTYTERNEQLTKILDHFVPTSTKIDRETSDKISAPQEVSPTGNQ